LLGKYNNASPTKMWMMYGSGEILVMTYIRSRKHKIILHLGSRRGPILCFIKCGK